ncbi:MAG: O-antigen ligase family protein [Thermoanaerobaculia bacterium]
MSAEPAQIEPSRSAKAGFWLFGLHLWTIFGLALSNAFLALTGLVVPWAVRWREVPWHGLRRVLTPLGLYALTVLVSVAYSYDPWVSLEAGREVLSLGTLFLALVLMRGEPAVRKVVTGVILVSGLLAAWGLGQFLVGMGDINHRIRGPFSHYMTFAGVLLIADLLLIAQMVCGSGRRSAWRWGALLVINLALVASLTRSAWVALGLTFTILLLLRAPRFVAAYVPAALLFLVIAPVSVVHRVISIVDLRDSSNYDRVCMAEAGLHMIRERPLLGLGPGMVEERYPIYRHPSAIKQTTAHLHNSFLQIAAEEGLLALAAYLWLMLGTLALAYRHYVREDQTGGSRADLFMGAFLALLAFNLAGLFEDNWGDTEVQRMALFVTAVPYCLLSGAPSAAEPEEGSSRSG